MSENKENDSPSGAGPKPADVPEAQTGEKPNVTDVAEGVEYPAHADDAPTDEAPQTQAASEAPHAPEDMSLSEDTAHPEKPPQRVTLSDPPPTSNESADASPAEASGDAGQDPAPPQADAQPAPDEADIAWEELQTLIERTLDTKVGERLGEIDRRLGNINQRMKENRESVQTLFEENRQSRGGVETALLVPVFKGLLHTLEKMTMEQARAQETGDEALANLLDVFRVDLLNTMEDFGLEEEPKTDVTDSPRMDPRTQNIVETVAGPEDMHKRVAKVVAPAYSYKGTRFTKERVIVYKRSNSAQQMNS